MNNPLHTICLKTIVIWLWPSIVITISALLHYWIKQSPDYIQGLESIIFCVGYFIFVIPVCYLLSKGLKNDLAVSLLILFITYFFFNYESIFIQWTQSFGEIIYQYFFNKNNSSFLIAVSCIGLCLALFLKKVIIVPQKLVIAVTVIIIFSPFVPSPFSRNYNYTKLLNNPLKSDSTISKQFAPQRIFWIILDEHPSFTSMHEVWNDHDTSMRQDLTSLGFTIYDSCRANYNYTPFSIASITNASMLPVNEQQNIDYNDWLSLSKSVCGSSIISFFVNQGYSLHWLSFFDSLHIPLPFAPTSVSFFKQTIIGMFGDRFNAHFGSGGQYDINIITKFNNYNNYVIDSLAYLLKSFPSNGTRQFIYAHLLMPHYPYINVRPPYSIDRHSQFAPYKDNRAFFNYVKYTDSLIIKILQNSLKQLTPSQKSNTLIILQSDHGYRFLEKGSKESKLKSSFGTLNAVLWPPNKKGSFYNGMSSVNTFRILLRDYWGVNISTLKDSSVNVFLTNF